LVISFFIILFPIFVQIEMIKKEMKWGVLTYIFAFVK
jgi:hypothetical protein